MISRFQFLFVAVGVLLSSRVAGQFGGPIGGDSGPTTHAPTTTTSHNGTTIMGNVTTTSTMVPVTTITTTKSPNAHNSTATSTPVPVTTTILMPTTTKIVGTATSTMVPATTTTTKPPGTLTTIIMSTTTKVAGTATSTPAPVTTSTATTTTKPPGTLTTTKGPGITTSTKLSDSTVTVKPVTLPTTRSPSNTTFDPYCSTDEALSLAGECYLALESLSTKMGKITAKNALQPAMSDELNGYCSTIGTCYDSLEKCGDFSDANATNIILDFCSFFQFFTSKQFLRCSQEMELIGGDTPCIDQATSAVLDFNSTIASRCSSLTSVSSCAVSEVDDVCNSRATQLFQMFINRFIQKWTCPTS